MDLSGMFFDGWGAIVRTLIVGTLAYAILVATLRVSGKRTLAKLNAFDLVVTVALGSTLASVLTSSNVALAQGIAAFVTLIGLQFVVAWLSVQSGRFARLVRSEPTLLVRRGEILEGALAQSRVTEAELKTVIRNSNHPDPSNVAAVILESDGSFSVIGQEHGGAEYAEAGLQGDLARDR